MTEERWLIVCRPVDPPTLAPLAHGSVRGWYCEVCAVEVWVSPDSLRLIETKRRTGILCTPCGLAMAPDDEPVRAAPGASKSAHEVARQLGTIGNFRRLFEQ